MPDIANGRELAEIIRTLARMDANIETLVKNQEKHEARISWVESKVNWAAGAMAVIVFGLSFALDFVKNLFKAS